MAQLITEYSNSLQDSLLWQISTEVRFFVPRLLTKGMDCFQVIVYKRDMERGSEILGIVYGHVLDRFD